VGVKENNRFILNFPPAGNVQPLPRRQGFSTCSGCSGRQTFYITNALTSSSSLSLMLSRHHTIWNIALVSFESAVLAMSQDFAHPQPTGEEGNVGEMALVMCKHC